MYVVVSTNGATPKWMVYNGKSQSQMDDLGVPPCQETFMYMCFATCSISEVETHTSYEPPKLILDPVVRHEPSTEHGATTSVGSCPSNMKYTTRNPGI